MLADAFPAPKIIVLPSGLLGMYLKLPSGLDALNAANMIFNKVSFIFCIKIVNICIEQLIT